MGMYDEIRCEAPLPDGYGGGGVWFQSKSFPDPCLSRYTITRQGRLIDALGNDLEIEGYITFYTGDPSGGADRWREYRARFVKGDLQDIACVPEVETDDRRYGIASFRWFDTPSFMFDGPDDIRA